MVLRTPPARGYAIAGAVSVPQHVRGAADRGAHAGGGEPVRRGLPALELPKTFAQFGWGDAVVTALGGAATLTMALVKPSSANRTNRVGVFDSDVRSALRAPSFQGRYLARDASDVLLSLALTYPFFVDALITAWWFRGSAKVAQQMALVNAEAFALAGALQGVTNVLAGRERPYGQDCGALLPSQGIDCDSSGRYRSFFSGHATFSFTAASLICSHHMLFGLFGNRGADAMSCVSAYLLAGATATLRVVGDMHHATDVVTGSLVGTAIGLSVPWLHYTLGGAPSVVANEALRLRLRIAPLGAGAALAGIF
jgi:membrane-associated phospholipid phosphatase